MNRTFNLNESLVKSLELIRANGHKLFCDYENNHILTCSVCKGKLKTTDDLKKYTCDEMIIKSIIE